MRQIRGYIALIAGVLLVQLQLGGIGAGCVVHGATARPSDQLAGGAHAQVLMGVMVMGDADAANAMASSEDESTAGHAGCSLPCVPGACATTNSCAPPILVEPIRSLALPATAARVIVVRAAIPSNLLSPPELPPPRA